MTSTLPSSEHGISDRPSASEWKRCELLLSGQKDILQIIASSADSERAAEALAHLAERIQPDIKCAIFLTASDRTSFSHVCAPNLSRRCRVPLLQSPVTSRILNGGWRDSHDQAEPLVVDLTQNGNWKHDAWANALTAEGFQICLFVPVVSPNRQPLAIFSLFGCDKANFVTSDSQLVQTAIHLTAIACEMSEREGELCAERERLSLALAGGKLGIWNWDLRTNEFVWSEQCKSFFGFPPDAKIGFEQFLGVVHSGDRDRTVNAIEESIRKDVPCDVEYRVVHPDGTVRWVAATGRTFRDDFDRPIRMGGVARDVTDEKEFDAELQEYQSQLRSALAAAELARREAESAIKAKDQFLAVLSHELRTPLTPITMAASWLRNAEELSDQARNAFDMIFRNAELEARLIDDLLDLTRVARNQLELQFQTVDVHAVLRAAIEVCELGIQEKRQSLDLQLAAARSLVQGDIARLQQVFWNLLKNAIKFTPEGGSISVKSRNDKQHIVVQVSDTGIGIEPKMIPKIFLAFEQADRDIVKQFGGLGLGLAISRAIIDAHRGAIAVHSDGKDLGSIFTVRLRLSDGRRMP
jgi:PAS domain S-box-containing protein